MIPVRLAAALCLLIAGCGHSHAPTTPVVTETAGEALFQTASAEGVACAACHGPNGNWGEEGFEPLVDHAHDLRVSSMSGDELRLKVACMWDNESRNGSGAFDSLSAEQQSELVGFVESLRVEGDHNHLTDHPDGSDEHGPAFKNDAKTGLDVAHGGDDDSADEPEEAADPCK